MARILVIDDESNIRMMVELVLEQAGHDVDTAADGPSGLEKFGDGAEYDIVLLDQRLPGMEGLEVLREMKSRNTGARIVMITAFGTIDLAVDAMKAGATDFLRKPFTTETLRGAVLGALMTTPKTESARPEEAAQEESLEAPFVSPIMYGLTTVNGYYIESDPTNVAIEAGDMRYSFSVRHPSGTTEQCVIVLAADATLEVRKSMGGAALPGDDRFWHALCEHVLSNYIYQHAGLPPGNSLRVETIDRGLRNWIKAVRG